MPEFTIIDFDASNPDHQDTVKRLFTEYYAYFHSLGIKLPLADNGAELWLNTIYPSLNKLGMLPLAMKGGQIIGFAHGSVKLLPAYLGGHMVGVVQHVYVAVEYQRQGVAELMIDYLDAWFRKKQVHSVELQVIDGNDQARRFWEKMGFRIELQQMRRLY